MGRRHSVRTLCVRVLLDLEVRGRQGPLGQAWSSRWDRRGPGPVVAAVSGEAGCRGTGGCSLGLGLFVFRSAPGSQYRLSVAGHQ